MTSVKIIVIPKSTRLKARAKKSLEYDSSSADLPTIEVKILSPIFLQMLLSLIDLGCILSLWPKMTLKKRKRKFGDMERIESQLFQKVWGQEDRSGTA